MEGITQQLKSETRDLHDRVEQHLNSHALLSESYTPEEYLNLLQELYRAHRLLEPAILAFDDIKNQPVLEPRRRLSKTGLIEKDIRSMGAEPRKISGSNPLKNAAEAWGAMYVLEGSSLGGAMILKHLKKHRWARPALEFYGYYAADTGRLWKSFRELLESEARLKGFDTRDVLQGARKAYAVFLDEEVGATA